MCLDDGNNACTGPYREVLVPWEKPLLAIYPNIIGRRNNDSTQASTRSPPRRSVDRGRHVSFHHIQHKLYAKTGLTSWTRSTIEAGAGGRWNGPTHRIRLSLRRKIRARRTRNTRGGLPVRPSPSTGGPLKLPLDRNSSPYDLPRYMLVRATGKTSRPKDKNPGGPRQRPEMSRNAISCARCRSSGSSPLSPFVRPRARSAISRDPKNAAIVNTADAMNTSL